MNRTLEDFFLKFHRENPGRSPLIFGSAQDDTGRASYDWLADHAINLTNDAVILDLGCGDGTLLQIVRTQNFSGQLIGVDFSHAELALARERPLEPVTWLCENAKSLSLASGSVDIVLSHMAVMLMQPATMVLKEIARVLKPGGLFAAVTSADQIRGPVMKAFLEAFHRVWDEDVGDWIMTDDPCYRSKTVYSQLAKKYDLETECFEQKITRSRLHPSVLWEQLASTYHVAMLSPAAKERLRLLTLDAWRSTMDDGGHLSADFVVNRLLCRKKKTPG